MFNKKEGNANTSTVIGEGIKIEGAVITGNGGVRIDGEYFGNINIEGNIIIGESGYVKGDIKVKHALLAGKVDGNISCTTGIHLSSTGKLFGNVEATALIVDEGAVFSGTSMMGNNNGPKKEKNPADSNDAKAGSLL